MNQTKYQHLQSECNHAVSQNKLEKCIELLQNSLDESEKDTYNEFILIQGNLNNVLYLWNTKQSSLEDYSISLSKVRASMLGFINRIRPQDVSLLKRIHDMILIVACKQSPTDWERLFPDAYFSHAKVIRYGDAIPDAFQKADVIILDDLGDYCEGMNQADMIRYATEIPNANLLYIGKKNPWGDSKAYKHLFERCANAGSQITVHARLRELLEFKKYFGA